jgi:hypothetical protein
MYSVEITVEKDKVTGETRVLSSTTLLPRDPLPQGIKVYEDETKGMRTPGPCPALPWPESEPRMGVVTAYRAVGPTSRQMLTLDGVRLTEDPGSK